MHCYFCCHIAENIKSAFIDAAIVMKLLHVTNAYRPAKFEAYMTDIRAVTLEAFNYIEAIGRKCWVNAFIEGRWYDMLTSNVTECTNRLLKGHKSSPYNKTS